MEAAEKKMGDPSDAKTAYGPLADKKQFERVMSFLDGAREEGIQVLVGGERQGTKGAFIKPTVFLNPDLKSKVYTDEIFGPVISVRTFKDEAEAIQLANDTTYGLGCKFSTQNPSVDDGTNVSSNHLHLRHRPCTSGCRSDRSRHCRHQLSFQHLASNSIRWLQAKRHRSGERSGGY